MFENTSYSDYHIRVVFQFVHDVIHRIIVCTRNFNPDNYSDVPRVFGDVLRFYLLVSNQYSTCMELSTTGQHQFAVIYDIRNRHDHIQLHLSSSRIPIAPIIDRKISSPLYLLGENFHTRKTEKTYLVRANITRDRNPSRRKSDTFSITLQGQTACFSRSMSSLVVAGQSAVLQTPRERRLVLW